MKFLVLLMLIILRFNILKLLSFQERQREVFLRDIRNLGEPVATYSADTSLK